MPQASVVSHDLAKGLRDHRTSENARLDRWLARWLARTHDHFIRAHLTVAAGLAALVNVALALFGSPDLTVVETIGSELCIGVVALSLPALLTTLALRKPLRSLYRTAVTTPAIFPFLDEALRGMHEDLFDLRAHGAMLPSVEIAQWVRRCCFRYSAGRYIGTDVCTPSEFLERYDGAYLNAHEEYLDRTHHLDTVRISLADSDALAADARRNPDVYVEYLAWHRQHDVVLLHAQPARARALAERHHLVGVSDVTMWLEDYVLAWDYEEPWIRIRLGFVDELLYDRSAAYLRDLLAIARPFPESPG